MGFFDIADGSGRSWNNWEKNLLRFFLIYFIIQIVPLDWKFYRQLFSIHWSAFSFYDLFQLTRYYPRFFGLEGFANWAITAGIAAILTFLWSRRAADNYNYDVLYYWLRVLLRYRLAIGVIAYGLIKVFPLQMPYPSLSNLHTNYGDFFPWKIYFHTVGIVPVYERFLGAVEVIAGILLFFRKTATFGAGIILGFIGNVLVANFAYDAGEKLYSAYLLVLAAAIFAYDAPRLYRLLIQGKYTKANRFKPLFAASNWSRLRTAARVAFILFVVSLSFATYANSKKAPYKLPAAPGLANSFGFYNVREFRFNNRLIPYSTTDSNRWQNVVFEKWATLSIKIAKPITIDNNFGDRFEEADIDRDFESAGVGGRRYFAYSIDSAANKLSLQNKNPHHRTETFQLSVERPNDSTIVVQGVNEKKDSVYAVLEKINRKYLLFEGRRKRVKL